LRSGGIRLSASNARVYSDTVRNVTYYGIYGEQASGPTIKNCVLDTSITGIYLTSGTKFIVRRTQFKQMATGVLTYARPNLGIASDSGFNDFQGCSNWYIRYISGMEPPPSLYAIGNYYGPGTPDSAKFSPGVIYTPWLPDRPRYKKGIAEYIPLVYSLNSNYPNPFNPQTTISFNLMEPAQTRVLIFNILGQKIKTLVNEYLSPGQYSYIWDGRNELGIDAASGVYLYRIESGSFIQTKKMTLIR
jgi:hypothetical protein